MKKKISLAIVAVLLVLAALGGIKILTDQHACRRWKIFRAAARNGFVRCRARGEMAGHFLGHRSVTPSKV